MYIDTAVVLQLLVCDAACLLAAGVLISEFELEGCKEARNRRSRSSSLISLPNETDLALAIAMSLVSLV